MTSRPGWTRHRIKFVTEVNRETLPEGTDEEFAFDYVDIGRVSQGLIDPTPLEMVFGDAPSRARRLAEPGDTIVSTVRTYLRAVATVGSSDVPQVFSTGFAVLHPRGSLVHPSFLSYYLQSNEFVDRIVANSVGVSYPAINASDVAALDLWLPDVPEQRSISDFLDRETAQIDAMIGAQEDLVDRLEERSRAMFAHEAQARVNSGARLKWSLRESDARAGDLAARLPLLSVSIDWGVRRRDASINQSASEDLTNYKVVRRGDVVVNRMRAFQGALGRAPEDGIASPDYSVFQCSPSADSEWLVFLMRSSPFISEMASRIRGIGSPDAGQVRTPRINANDLLDIRVEIPDLDTQRAEVASWQRRAAQMSRLIEASRESTALMQERRSALVSAAVTGGIDPRTGEELTPETVLESV